MPKIDPEILKDFGKAVKRARVIKGWDQSTLGGKIEPPVGPSFISKVEKGRKEALDARTVGRFRITLDLDESWIDRFLDAEDAAESLETKSERDADLLIDRLRREGKAKGASDDLLIQLANNFTQGDHKDRDTAYRSVEAALERLKASEHIARLTGSAGAQFAEMVKEVDVLNNEGEFDLAHDKLAQHAELLREEKDTLARLSELQLQKELAQDRLRNRPDLAADRIIENLREFSQGKRVNTMSAKVKEWMDEGHFAGDIFALEVALTLARANYEQVKPNKPMSVSALLLLGACYLRLAEPSSGDRHLIAAWATFDAALNQADKAESPEIWAECQSDLGTALEKIGYRRKDVALLEQAVANHRAGVEIKQQINSADLKFALHSLGNTLQALGEQTKEENTLREAEDALTKALALKNKNQDPLDWAATQNNLARSQRHLGAVTSDPVKLQEARDGYAACEDLALEGDAPFLWAALQWNIADLDLTRYQLDPDPALLAEARMHVNSARAFFVESSDYQTERCDDLLAQIGAAFPAS